MLSKLCETIADMVTKMKMFTRCYKELKRLPTFEERFEYLKLNGIVGEETFGFDRYINQIFYKSKEWLSVRNRVITRDLGCDLGILDREIQDRILIHHMNPITKEDILERKEWILDPEYLICVSDNTHKAIHYGDTNLLVKDFTERCKNDTCPWRK